MDPIHKVIMDWSPKGNSAVMLEMIWDGVPFLRGLDYDKKVFSHSVFHEYFNIYGEATQSEFHNPEYYKFKVVRNPWDRAVSIYNHIMHTNQSIFFYLNDDLVNSLAEVNLTLADQKEGMSFEQFLEVYEFVQNKTDNFKVVKHATGEGNKDQIEGHRAPQVNHFEYQDWLAGKKSWFDYIVKLENFDEGITEVNRNTKMNYQLPVNEHHIGRNMSAEPRYVGNLAWSHLRSNVPGNYNFYYNEYTNELVRKLYMGDVLVYNYSYPYSVVYV